MLWVLPKHYSVSIYSSTAMVKSPKAQDWLGRKSKPKDNATKKVRKVISSVWIVKSKIENWSCDFQKIIFPIIFGEQGLILRFPIIKNHNQSNSIKKYPKIKKKFFEIFHPRGLDQNPRKNQLRGEVSKIASVGPKVLTIRTYMQNFKSLASLVWAVGVPGFEKWT